MNALLFKVQVDPTGDVVLYPEMDEMDLHTDISQIQMEFTVSGPSYGLCNLIVHGCAGEFNNNNSNNNIFISDLYKIYSIELIIWLSRIIYMDLILQQLYDTITVTSLQYKIEFQ